MFLRKIFHSIVGGSMSGHGLLWFVDSHKTNHDLSKLLYDGWYDGTTTLLNENDLGDIQFSYRGLIITIEADGHFARWHDAKGNTYDYWTSSSKYRYFVSRRFQVIVNEIVCNRARKNKNTMNYYVI